MNLVWKLDRRHVEGRYNMEWFNGPVAAAITTCKQKDGILIVYVRGK